MTDFWSVLWCDGKSTEEFETELKKIEKEGSAGAIGSASDF